jgi:hypothetical protein
MTWEWVLLILGIVWAVVATLGIAAWSDVQRRKPRSLAEALGGRRDRTLTTVSVQPYDDEGNGSG